MSFRKLALIGVGLLGGSLGLAVKQRRLAARVEGYVRRESSVAECLAAGAVDQASTDLAAVIAEADLVVLCTPIGQMGSLARSFSSKLAPGALVTDVGSVKETVVRELEPLIAAAGGLFVGSHPMAGAEKMGVSHARADLFAGAVCVVTPTAQTPPAALEAVENLWRGVGGRVLRLSPEAHDVRVARSSHLPQALAATLANLVLDEIHGPEQARLCAGGFRDGTRIASGSPEMWRDIMLSNREPLLRALGEYAERIEELRRAVERGDVATISGLLESAKRRRDGWLNSPAHNSSE
ncbi:MAG: prephenate dehydrogenase [Limisphaerales bacterium]